MRVTGGLVDRWIDNRPGFGARKVLVDTCVLLAMKEP